LDTKILIETLIAKVEELQNINRVLMKRIAILEAELAIYKNQKNSRNSSVPPSKDENRPLKNQSLRTKSSKKAGGQPGHEGRTLQCSGVVDSIVDHAPEFCNCCGKDLSDAPETLIESRQFIDIPVIKPVCIEHRVYRKTCTCGHTTESEFPSTLTSKVQYGPNVESLTAYLHARQYLPYHRMKEFFADVMNLPLSVGGIHNILKRITQKAFPHYEQIKQRIGKSIFAGTDETGVKVNGEKDWIWTWQNDELTFITHSDNRGFKTIEDNFAKGLPDTVLIHDRFACHFNCEAMHHQICMSHVLRDLQYIAELYPKNNWATEMKTLIMEALELKKQLTITQYYTQVVQRDALQKRLMELLGVALDPTVKKARSLQRNLLKHQEHVLYFLYHPKIPPDNNGSERAIRNIKVKQKISGQFKSAEGADMFAILRSVIDTTIKSGQNVLNALSLIAILGTE